MDINRIAQWQIVYILGVIFYEAGAGGYRAAAPLGFSKCMFWPPPPPPSNIRAKPLNIRQESSLLCGIGACPPPPPLYRQKNNIGFPAHVRTYLFIQFHQFSIQFRPEKLIAFKSKVQFRQIVIHIRVLSIKFLNSAFKFVNCH